jgi:predicted  nucleic acid-binding Zn-ribbon protein
MLGLLLAGTLSVAVEYYRILRRATSEYEKAKDSLEDVVLSFDRQLLQQANKLEATTNKVNALSSKVDDPSHRLVDLEKDMQTIESRLTSAQTTVQEETAKVEGLNKKLEELATSHSALTGKVSSVEEQIERLQAIPEPSVQAAIPIRRDKALAPLTETELSVLEMLASEGSKTAPEIKDRIRLSREHTARLMKKLYEGGYLERDTSGTPFKYSVKKEMGAILKKDEGEAS